jgi:hypothetical protein
VIFPWAWSVTGCSCGRFGKRVGRVACCLNNGEDR